MKVILIKKKTTSPKPKKQYPMPPSLMAKKETKSKKIV